MKIKANTKTSALFAVTVCAASVFAQTANTARVPVVVNGSQLTTATVTITPPVGSNGVGVSGVSVPRAEETVFTLSFNTTSGAAPSHSPRGTDVPSLKSRGRGRVVLNLPSRHYQSADIALHSVNGRRVLRGNAAAEAGARISRSNVPAGVYILSVKGANGSSFSHRLSHGGGGFQIDAEFGVEHAPPLRKPLISADAGAAWTIAVTAVGAYNNETVTEIFTPKVGDNARIVVTFSSSSGSAISIPPDMAVVTPPPDGDGTYAPDMLGIVPGTNISEIRLTWYSSGSSSRPAVRLYDESGTYVTGKDSCWSASAGSSRRSNKCVLRGLEPNTRYKYSVSHNNGGDWSYKYEYKTSAGGNRFKFAAVADPQIHPNVNTDNNLYPGTEWMGVLPKIIEHNVDFIMCAGDQTDSYMGDEAEYALFFAPPELRGIALSPVVGNHDAYHMFSYHFNLPNALPAPSSYNQAYIAGNYWYLYNNVLVVALNTGLTTNLEQVKLEVQRYDALIADAKARSAGNYDWLIVLHHRSTRSIGYHAAQTAPAQYLDTTLVHFKNPTAGFEAMIDRHGVDLVIAGHEHLYTRTHPLKNDRIVAAGEGTVYLTLLPAGSSKYYAPSTTEASWEAKAYPSRADVYRFYTATQSNEASIYEKPGYTIVDVNGTTMTVTTYRDMAANAVVDEFVLTK